MSDTGLKIERQQRNKKGDRAYDSFCIEDNSYAYDAM